MSYLFIFFLQKFFWFLSCRWRDRLQNCQSEMQPKWNCAVGETRKTYNYSKRPVVTFPALSPPPLLSPPARRVPTRWSVCRPGGIAIPQHETLGCSPLWVTIIDRGVLVLLMRQRALLAHASETQANSGTQDKQRLHYGKGSRTWGMDSPVYHVAFIDRIAVCVCVCVYVCVNACACVCLSVFSRCSRKSTADSLVNNAAPEVAAQPSALFFFFFLSFSSSSSCPHLNLWRIWHWAAHF